MVLSAKQQCRNNTCAKYDPWRSMEPYVRQRFGELPHQKADEHGEHYIGPHIPAFSCGPWASSHTACQRHEKTAGAHIQAGQQLHLFKYREEHREKAKYACHGRVDARPPQRTGHGARYATIRTCKDKDSKYQACFRLLLVFILAKTRRINQLFLVLMAGVCYFEHRRKEHEI